MTRIAIVLTALIAFGTVAAEESEFAVIAAPGSACGHDRMLALKSARLALAHNNISGPAILVPSPLCAFGYCAYPTQPNDEGGSCDSVANCERTTGRMCTEHCGDGIQDDSASVTQHLDGTATCMAECACGCVTYYSGQTYCPYAIVHCGSPSPPTEPPPDTPN